MMRQSEISISPCAIHERKQFSSKILNDYTVKHIKFINRIFLLHEQLKTFFVLFGKMILIAIQNFAGLDKF